MYCSKCGSDNVEVKEETYVIEKGGSIIINILLCIITGGIWLIYLIFKGLSGKSKKSKTMRRKYAICHNCGNTFELENKKI